MSKKKYASRAFHLLGKIGCSVIITKLVAQAFFGSVPTPPSDVSQVPLQETPQEKAVVVEQTTEAEMLKAAYDLTSIARFDSSQLSVNKELYASYRDMKKTALGRTILCKLDGRKLWVGTRPPIVTKHEDGRTGITLGGYSAEHKLMIVSPKGEDPTNSIHEAIHAGLQANEKGLTPSLAASTASKELPFELAEEMGAKALSFIERYVEDGGKDLVACSNTTLTDSYIAINLIKLLDENPEYRAALKDHNKLPPAELVDRLAVSLIKVENGRVKDTILGECYGVGYYNMLKSRASPDFGDGSPTDKELAQAMVGDLYSAEELPRSMAALREIGQQATNMAWFDRQFSDQYQQANAYVPTPAPTVRVQTAVARPVVHPTNTL